VRTSFDLKILVETMEEAINDARVMIASFLAIPAEEVYDKVDVEFKVSLPKAESAAEVGAAMDEGQFVVHVYGTVKRSMAKPFGA
jgi:hypothetical protein